MSLSTFGLSNGNLRLTTAGVGGRVVAIALIVGYVLHQWHAPQLVDMFTQAELRVQWQRARIAGAIAAASVEAEWSDSTIAIVELLAAAIYVTHYD